MSKPIDQIMRQIAVIDVLIGTLDKAEQAAMDGTTPDNATWSDASTLAQVVDTIIRVELIQVAQSVVKVQTGVARHA